MTDGTAVLNESISALPDVITLADAETVDYLERVYNATSADQKAFVENYAKLAVKGRNPGHRRYSCRRRCRGLVLRDPQTQTRLQPVGETRACGKERG